MSPREHGMTSEIFLHQVETVITNRSIDGSIPTRIIFHLITRNHQEYNSAWKMIIDNTNASDERNRRKPHQHHDQQRTVRIDYTTFNTKKIGYQSPVFVEGFEVQDNFGGVYQYEIRITIQKFIGSLNPDILLAIMQASQPRLGHDSHIGSMNQDNMNMILSMQRGGHPQTLTHTCHEESTLDKLLHVLLDREQMRLDQAFKDKFYYPIALPFDNERRLVFMNFNPQDYHQFKTRFLEKRTQDPLYSFFGFHVMNPQIELNSKELFTFFVDTRPYNAQHLIILPIARYFRILLEIDPNDSAKQKIVMQGVGFPDSWLETNGNPMNHLEDPSAFRYFIKQLEKLHIVIAKRRTNGP